MWHEKVFQAGSSFVDGAEHHAAARLGVRAAGDFIITTIPPVNDLDLKLPTAAKRLKDPPRKANYISVQADGTTYLNKARFTSATDMLQTLIGLRTDDPDLNIIIRADGKAKYRQIRAVLDVCQQANVPKVDLATESLTK